MKIEFQVVLNHLSKNSNWYSRGPLFNILSTIFATLVGRRMGTETDGTTLRSNPQSSVSAVASVPGQVEHFPANTRDTTVKLQYKVSAVVTRIRRNVGCIM